MRRTLSPALGVESSETGCVPWVRLESVIRRILQAVCSTVVENELTPVADHDAQRPALGIKSSETGGVPRVRLESVIRRISQGVLPASQDLVDYEGTLPLGLEFVLFLFWQA